MDRKNRLHIRDLVSDPISDSVDRDGVYFFMADKISDTGFIMKTALNLMNKGYDAFYFLGKYKDIWQKTVEDILSWSNTDCKSLKSCDSMDDAVNAAAGFLNSGRDVYLLCDSRKLGAIAAGKIKEHELQAGFHANSLVNGIL